MATGNNTAAAAKLHSVSDESLSNNILGKYHLSLQSGEGVFSWCLLGQEFNRYLALESYSIPQKGEDELLEELTKNTWFSHVGSVSLAYVSDKITLVPEPLFSEQEKENYSRFNFGKELDNEQLLSAKLRNAGCYAVYAVPGNTVQRFRYFFPQVKIMHTCMPLIESVLLDNKNETVEKVTLNIRPGSFELLITKGASLLYYNSFSYASKEDVIYYLLFALEQLKLNPETVALQLAGEIEKNDALYSIIHKYVRKVSFGARNSRFEYSYRFNDLQPHAFFSLFSQYLCV